jgi:hypothetical protein
VSSIWKRTDGKIIKGPEDEGGKIITCDDCPCGECGGQPSSFFCELVRLSDSATWTGTLTFQLTAPVDCRTAYGVTANIFDPNCFWFCANLDHPSENDRRIYLYPSVQLSPGVPAWQVNWGLVFTPASCSGQQQVLGKPGLWTSTSPLGTYTDTLNISITLS